MQKWIILGVIIAIIIATIVIVFNVNIETEYVPETEIEETEYRKTIVTLYFSGDSSDELKVETRLIDSKDLLVEPYKYLINMLIEGPENSSNKSYFPEGVELISANAQNSILTINFSSEFLDVETNDELKSNILSIYNTVRELKEIDSIKILIENNENEEINRIMEESML